MELEFLDAKSEFMKEIVNCEADYIREQLTAGETLHGLTVGVFQEEYGLYAVTSERLIFCATASKEGLYREYPISNIDEVILQKTGLYNVRMSVDGTFFRLGISWQVADQFQSLCTDLISGSEVQQAA